MLQLLLQLNARVFLYDLNELLQIKVVFSKSAVNPVNNTMISKHKNITERVMPAVILV